MNEELVSSPASMAMEKDQFPIAVNQQRDMNGKLSIVRVSCPKGAQRCHQQQGERSIVGKSTRNHRFPH